MKLYADERISRKAATYLGRLTRIDWAKGEGWATLDAPKAAPGQTPAEPVEVKCGFRYAGQHWIWQQANPLFAGDVEAYPEEDAASHSAFAFCVGDRVVLLHKDRERSAERQTGQTGQTGDEGEDDGKEYVAVAVLEERERDDGAGGVVVDVTLRKRKVWPLYRLGHEAVVLNVRYREEEDKGAGFPFVSADGRTPVNPFLDWKDHVRALGTIGGAGNPRLVATREKIKEKRVNATGQEEEVETDVYVPHAIHEFCEPDEDIPYVPDVFMRTKPNWKGRVIGWSAQNEVLIDNIPVARVRSAADVETLIEPSWRAATRKLVHIDERAGVLTVLHVTADCHFDWRAGAEAGGEADWRPPKYAFHVMSGSTPFRCVYEAMGTPREELPVVELREDAEASWPWADLQAEVEAKTWLRDTQIDNLSGETLEVVPPDEVLADGSVKAGEAEVWFWGGCKMFGMNAYNPARHDRRCKISLVFGNVGKDDPAGRPEGGLKVEKRVGGPEPWSPFNKETLRSAVTLTSRNPENGTYGFVLEDHAEILGHEVEDEEGNTTRSGYVEEEAARAGGNALVVRLSGHDHYTDDPKVCDTELTRTYLHRTPDGDHEIVAEAQRLAGRGYDDIRTTMSTVVFTLTDVRRGVYGFWEISWFDDKPAKYVTSEISARPPDRWFIRWRHYLWTKAGGKVSTHSYDYEVPFCLHGPYTNAELTDPSSVPDSELERHETIRLLSLFHYKTGAYTGKKWPGHHIWDVPRLYEDGEEMKPTVPCYKEGTPFTFAPVHHIVEFLLMTQSHRGGKRMVVTSEYEHRFWSGRSVAFRPYTFSLHPFPNKWPWIWPHFRNLCRATPWAEWTNPAIFPYDSGVAGILFSESMHYDGFATEDEYFYWVSIKGQSNTTKLFWSPGMERLLTCTGRGDAAITLD